MFRTADQPGQTLEETRRGRPDDTGRSQIKVPWATAEGGRVLLRGDPQFHGEDHFPATGYTLFSWAVRPRRRRLQERQATTSIGGETGRLLVLQRPG